MQGVFWHFLLNSALAFLVDLLVSDVTPISSSALLSLPPPIDSQAFYFRIRTIDGNSFQGIPSPDVILDYTYSKTISAQILEEGDKSIVIAMHRDCPETEIRIHLRAQNTQCRL